MTTLANSRFAALLLLTTVPTGCATTNAFQLGKNAELAQDYDRAVIGYTRALQQDPDNRAPGSGLNERSFARHRNTYMRGRR